MSHGMLANDVQFGLEMAWHKLTRIVKKITGFPFEYEKTRTAYEVDGKWIVDEGNYRLIGSDDRAKIGKPIADSYGVVSCARFWDLVDGALAGTGAKVVSLGTFGGRAKRYATISVGTEWERFKVGAREFSNFLNIQDAIDGSMPMIAKGSNTCIVCQNTFGFSLSERSEFKLSLKHTKNVADKLDNFAKAIEAYRGMTALFQRLMNEADTVKIAESEARQVIAGFLGEGKEMGTRTVNQVERMTELFRVGKGNNGRTVLDLTSAVTDFYTHESSGGENRWKQLTSSEIGSGNKAKTEFLNRIRTEEFTVNRVALAELSKAGRDSFAASKS